MITRSDSAIRKMFNVMEVRFRIVAYKEFRSYEFYSYSSLLTLSLQLKVVVTFERMEHYHVYSTF
jgi:hypothetical protein